MSYSASVPCRSAKAAAEMLAFLQEHLPCGEAGRARGPFASEQLQYARVRHGVGFDKPRPLHVAVLRWAALRAGKRRKFPDHGILEAVFWVNDDGMRSVPVLPSSSYGTTEDPYLQQLVVDEHGFLPSPRFWQDDDPERDRLEQRARREDDEIRPVLLRLSASWDARPGKAV